MLANIITSYNRSQTRNERIRIISLLVKDYSYKELRRFNQSNKSVKQDMCDEFENDEQRTLPFMDKARWSPDLKYNIYKKAVIHFRKNQYALAPVVEQQRYLWRINPSTIDLIFDFITSENVTNNGTYFFTACRKNNSV